MMRHPLFVFHFLVFILFFFSTGCAVSAASHLPRSICPRDTQALPPYTSADATASSATYDCG